MFVVRTANKDESSFSNKRVGGKNSWATKKVGPFNVVANGTGLETAKL